MKLAPKPVAFLIALLPCACIAPTNVIARGMNVTWDGTRDTVESFVMNERNSGDSGGGFLVYVDPDEDPVSSNYRPQARHEVASFAPSQTATFSDDFTPLARAENQFLARVHSITLRADPKKMVVESNEADNVLTTPLPSAAGATIIYGPSLVPLGFIQLNPGRFVGQKFTAPVSGSLVGLEITAVRCSPPSSVPLRLEIAQAGAIVGSASISTNAFPATCVNYPPSISGTAPGAGYFDLRGSPVPIALGESYAFNLYNDMSTGYFGIGMTQNLIDGNATDYGIDIMSIDLTYKLYIAD